MEDNVKSIYHSVSPRPWGQTVDATLVTECYGDRLRVTVYWDRNLRDQSRIEIARLGPAGFETLLYLHWYEVSLMRTYDAMQGPERELFDRDVETEARILEDLLVLSRLGYRIVGKL